MGGADIEDELGAVFARHIDAELAGDLELTLATMTANPHLVNVPTMVGGADLRECGTSMPTG